MLSDASFSFPMAALLAGLVLSLSLIVAIGAQNVFVLRQGLLREHVGVVVLLCATIDIVLMALGVSGVAASVGQHRGALNALAVVGALFLAGYGIAAARRAMGARSMQVNAGGAAQSLRRIITQTLTMTLLNPHVYLDTVLLVGAVGAQQPAEQRPAFVAGAGLGSVLWFASLGYGARLLTGFFANAWAWRVLDALVALTMMLSAAWLILGMSW